MAVEPVTPRGRQRRSALLAALETLLRDRPLAAVDVRLLTEEAGVSRSAFYFYFPSKEAAVEALLWDVFDEMVEATQQFLQGGAPSRPALREALQDVARLWGDHEHLLRAMVLAAGSDDGAAATWASWRRAWVAQITEVIEGERRAGHAPDGPPAAALAAVLCGMNIDAFLQPGPPPLDALLAVWTSTIYGGP